MAGGGVQWSGGHGDTGVNSSFKEFCEIAQRKGVIAGGGYRVQDGFNGSNYGMFAHRNCVIGGEPSGWTSEVGETCWSNIS